MVSAVRLWRVNNDSKLFPLTTQFLLNIPWEKVNKAICDEGKIHRVPDLTCSCGFYGVKLQEHFNNDPFLSYVEQNDLWFRFPWEKKYVLGKVNLWGGIVEQERGYRAEYAQVDTLYLSKEQEEFWGGDFFRKKLIRNYDCKREDILPGGRRASEIYQMLESGRTEAAILEDGKEGLEGKAITMLGGIP